jgi:hypothetical protein
MSEIDSTIILADTINVRLTFMRHAKLNALSTNLKFLQIGINQDMNQMKFGIFVKGIFSSFGTIVRWELSRLKVEHSSSDLFVNFVPADDRSSDGRSSAGKGGSCRRRLNGCDFGRDQYLAC